MSKFKFLVQKAGKNEFGITSYPVAATDEEIDQWFDETLRYRMPFIVGESAMEHLLDALDRGNEQIEKWFDKLLSNRLPFIVGESALECFLNQIQAGNEQLDQWFKEQWEEQWANHFAATRRFVRLEIEQAAKEPSDPTEDKIRSILESMGVLAPGELLPTPEEAGIKTKTIDTHAGKITCIEHPMADTKHTVVLSKEHYQILKEQAQWAEKAASVLLSNNTPVKASFAPLHELAATWNQITGEKP